jgi:hypothetical protein
MTAANGDVEAARDRVAALLERLGRIGVVGNLDRR